MHAQVPRLFLARLPTPIQKLEGISNELGKEVFIWRDDLTGFMESGNKLRKLEFLLADAQSKNCDWIITCGGPQSNHTRATAVAARQLGLNVSVLALAKPGYDHSKTPTGNLLLNQIYDTNLKWLNFDEFQKRGSSYDSFLEEEANRLISLGKKPYIIPLGGSNPIGCLGYMQGVAEMIASWKTVSHSPAPDSVFCALGSGGTFVGLKLGIQKQKLKTRLFGINVIGPIETANQYVSKLKESVKREFELSLEDENSEQIDGYVGAGYSIASDDDLKFYVELARKEGIMLDPCYTGKAFQGMISEIKKDPQKFGDQILFLHSGGTFGNFAYADQYQKILKSCGQ